MLSRWWYINSPKYKDSFEKSLGSSNYLTATDVNLLFDDCILLLERHFAIVKSFAALEEQLGTKNDIQIGTLILELVSFGSNFIWIIFSIILILLFYLNTWIMLMMSKIVIMYLVSFIIMYELHILGYFWVWDWEEVPQFISRSKKVVASADVERGKIQGTREGLMRHCGSMWCRHFAL